MVRTILTRGGEVLLAVGLVLLFFFSFMGLLSLAFPEGTSLADLMRSPRPVGGGGLRSAERRVDLGSGEESSGETSGGAIALLSKVHREVKDKPADAITWSDSRAGMPLGDLHSIQTFERSRATIKFSESAEMTLDENSLIVLRRGGDSATTETRKRASLIVLGGTLRGSIGGDRADGTIVEVRAATEAARLQTQAAAGKTAEFSVTVNDNHSSTFSVFGGTAQIVSDKGTMTVAPNQSVTVGAEGAFGPVLPLPPAPRPMAPNEGARQAYRSSRTRVQFDWAPPEPADTYVLTVARDPGFLDRVASESVEATTFTLGNLRAGRYWWRVRGVRAGLDGPESPARAFSIVQERRPPLLQVTFPGHVIEREEIVLQGRTTPSIKVFAGGEEAAVDDAGRFAVRLNLKRGVNVVVVEAVDEIGNVSYRSSIINANY